MQHPFSKLNPVKSILSGHDFKKCVKQEKVSSIKNYADEFQLIIVCPDVVKQISSPVPAIILDCGISDPFIETNRQLNSELLELKIPHDYIERSGNHSWEYWSNSIGYQLMFFHKYFKGLE